MKSVKKAFKKIGKAIKSVLKNKVVKLVGQVASAYFGGPIGAAAFSAVSTYAETGSLTAALTAGLKTAITNAAFNFAGDAFPGAIENTLAHAVIGCGSSVASGGKCGSGALSGGFSSAAANFGFIKSSWGPAGGTVASAVIGGTASVLGGGKFENGAVTGAFGYLFNYLSHPILRASVPGQVQFDNGMTALEQGRYGWAAAHFGGMLGEQVLTVLTFGEYGAASLASSSLTTSTSLGLELTSAQAANLSRFSSKLPSGNTGVYIDKLGDGVMFTSTVPGNRSGYAVYQKAVDFAGKTTSYVKTTFDNAGNVIHIKTKF